MRDWGAACIRFTEIKMKNILINGCDRLILLILKASHDYSEYMRGFKVIFSIYTNELKW